MNGGNETRCPFHLERENFWGLQEMPEFKLAGLVIRETGETRYRGYFPGIDFIRVTKESVS
jgi:hypothetical protein